MFHMEHNDREHRRAKVAAEVRAEMARQNLTRTSLAAAAGISTPTLRRRLDGNVPLTIDELEGILAVFNLTIPQFMDRIEPRLMAGDAA